MVKADELASNGIGERVRMIRRRRGLGQKAVADLMGVSQPHLSQLENGVRQFDSFGRIGVVAEILGCSIADLTGQPYLAPDRATADARATLPSISLALHDFTLDDVPDVPARPVASLAALAAEANGYTDEALYARAGRELGTVLTELHHHSVSDDADTRRAALAGLVEACIAAAGMARPLGNAELAATATHRGLDAARRLGDSALVGFAAMQHASSLTRIGAAHRACAIRADALSVLQDTDPTAADTRPAEAEARVVFGNSRVVCSCRTHRRVC